MLGELFSPVPPALETFVASQNACGGLNGHKIKLYIDDDQGDPATAASKVQQMIQNKKVLAFVGNIQVLTVDAVVPIIKKFGIPIIGGDLTNNTWFTNPLMFPQGSPRRRSPTATSRARRLLQEDERRRHLVHRGAARRASRSTARSRNWRRRSAPR